MPDLIEPFTMRLNMTNGTIDGSNVLMQRRLSDMRGMYHDAAAVEGLLSADDPVIYEVHATDALPHEDGQMLYCTTIIHPGRVGDEYYMTKGHFHSKRDQGEIYLGMQGRGMLLLQTDAGESRAVEMGPQTIAYVPPYWAHRTVNVGDEPFIFFSVWPGDAGHDYGTIERWGFPQLVVERDGAAALVDNPRYGG